MKDLTSTIKKYISSIHLSRHICFVLDKSTDTRRDGGSEGALC